MIFRPLPPRLRSLTARVAAMAILVASPLANGAPNPAVPAQWPGARPAAVLPEDDDSLLDTMERGAFRFFQEQADPHTGLVRDRARADGSRSEGKASIAASGF